MDLNQQAHLDAKAAPNMIELYVTAYNHVNAQFRNPLDPLLLRLSKDYINEADLSFRLQELFKVINWKDCKI